MKSYSKASSSGSTYAERVSVWQIVLSSSADDPSLGVAAPQHSVSSHLDPVTGSASTSSPQSAPTLAYATATRAVRVRNFIFILCFYKLLN